MRFKFSKLLLFFLVVVVMVGVGLVLVFRASKTDHTGKVSVTIDVAPDDSTVTANGEKIKTGTVWLTPGNYTFIASKSGFSDAKSEMTISSTNNYVALSPTAVSDAAKKWAEEYGYEIDGLSSREFEAKNAQILKNHPLLAVLPYTTDDFKITFDYRTNDSSSFYIIVTGADADGRTKALKWIRDQGYDPADYVFEFQGASTAPGTVQGGDL